MTKPIKKIQIEKVLRAEAVWLKEVIGDKHNITGEITITFKYESGVIEAGTGDKK